MAYTVKIHTFNDGKVMFEDRIAYANGEYVSMATLDSICKYFHCKIEDIIEFVE